MTFDVILTVPMGNRHGELNLDIYNGNISGYLTMFHNTEAFTGTISQNGEISLNGILTTLVKKYEFQATGYIKDDIIFLKLKRGKKTYELTGKKRKE